MLLSRDRRERSASRLQYLKTQLTAAHGHLSFYGAYLMLIVAMMYYARRVSGSGQVTTTSGVESGRSGS